MRKHLTLALVPAYLFLCLILGGASASGLWANVLLQLLAIPILFLSLIYRPGLPLTKSAVRLQLLVLALVVLFLVELVPLPPALWMALPGRDHVRESFELLGLQLPWLSISLTPHRTIAAALWLLPALAVLFAMLRLGAYRESWIGWVITFTTTVSVLLGAMQVGGGETSPWYFYEITNYGVTVGFFANANHMATLLVVTVPFLAGLYMSARSRGRGAQKSASLFLILGGFFGMVIVGLFINKSLAGIGLMLPVSAASVLLMLGRRKVRWWAIVVVALLTAGSVALVFSDRFDNNLTSDEAQTDVVSRYTTFTNSLEAAADYFPFGSGIGSFQPIYRMYEDAERVTTVYINHVHSDLIEIALETGVLGIALLLAFLIWWGRRTIAIWRAPEPDYLARAATIASAAIMAHSLVDYPLRTAAIGAIFAACCALIAGRRPPPKRQARSWPAMRPPRHLSAD